MDLFVSDLDGTLLNNEQKISRHSLETINRLISEGMQFSIATARSIDSAAKIIENLNLKLPIVLHNGVFVYDCAQRVCVHEALLNSDIAREIVAHFLQQGVSPFLFTTDRQQNKRIYYQGIVNEGERVYFEGRMATGDKRFQQVDAFDSCFGDKVITVLAIGDDLVLRPLYDFFRRNYEVHFHYGKDIYSGAYWLEITDKYANKKEGVRFLQSYLGAERLICFGDHINDCPMFEVADESYAVHNGADFLKEMATKVIGSNEEDAVANCLEALWRKKADRKETLD